MHDAEIRTPPPWGPTQKNPRITYTSEELQRSKFSLIAATMTTRLANPVIQVTNFGADLPTWLINRIVS